MENHAEAGRPLACGVSSREATAYIERGSSGESRLAPSGFGVLGDVVRLRFVCSHGHPCMANNDEVSTRLTLGAKWDSMLQADQRGDGLSAA